MYKFHYFPATRSALIMHYPAYQTCHHKLKIKFDDLIDGELSIGF